MVFRSLFPILSISRTCVQKKDRKIVYILLLSSNYSSSIETDEPVWLMTICTNECCALLVNSYKLTYAMKRFIQFAKQLLCVLPKYLCVFFADILLMLHCTGIPHCLFWNENLKKKILFFSFSKLGNSIEYDTWVNDDVAQHTVMLQMIE